MNPIVGEIVGTMILIVMGCGVCASGSLTGTFAKGTGWLLGSIGWGMAVAIAVFAVGEISGAHLNPAVTLALALTGDFAWGGVAGYIGAQFVGAFLGAVIVYFHYLPHWAKTEDAGTKLGVFSTSPGIAHTPSNVLSEFIATFIFVLCLLAIGANTFTEGLKPLIVGLLVMAIGNSLGSTTGYAINPARDLGPRIAHAILPIGGKGDSNWGYSWVPVLGPTLGGMYAALFYMAVFKGTASTLFWVASAAVVAFMIFAASRKSSATA
ncbi:MAG: glycerol uptake facilitator protein [Verrucomicrobiales bacterium]|jgi:glycerol uptake facilitator protein